MDRRDRPERLRGVAGQAASVAPLTAFLHASPDGPRDRELARGEPVTVLDRSRGWALVEAGRDGYCGYLADADLAPPLAATHVVSARQSHAYDGPDMKRPPLCRLPFGARLAVQGLDGRWAATDLGHVHRTHLRALDEPEDDPAAVALRFLGTPYLWAGNTGDGIDCSGLVQAALLACGIPCPADSDQQAARLGHPVEPGAPVRRGDLFFWAGHVAMAVDPLTLVHANAYRMAVTLERLDEAIDRIAAQGGGPVTARRRPG